MQAGGEVKVPEPTDRSLRLTLVAALVVLSAGLVAAVATDPDDPPPASAAPAVVSTTAVPSTTTTTSTATTVAPTTTTTAAVLGATVEASSSPPTTRAPVPAPRPASPPPPPPPSPAPAPALTVSPSAEAEVLQYVNARRAEHGVPAVTRNSCLDSISRAWSNNMATRQTATHNPSAASQASSCVAWTAAGENVGTAASAARVNQLWWDSASHRATMLSGAYTQVGIGAVWDGAKIWITVDFLG